MSGSDVMERNTDNGKEAFLSRVREALGRSRPMRSTPEHIVLRTQLPEQKQKVDTLLARAEARREDLLPRFATMAEKGGWRVARVASAQEAADRVAEIVRKAGARRVVRSDQPVFQRVPVEEALRQARISVAVMTTASGRSRAVLRQTAASAGVGITGVDYAIAETGTCVLMPRHGLSRLVSLLPPVCIAVVEPEQLLEELGDLLAVWRLEYLRGGRRIGSYMNLITGPSRSGDIEMTITVGVHGPGEAHLILLG